MNPVPCSRNGIHVLSLVAFGRAVAATARSTSNLPIELRAVLQAVLSNELGLPKAEVWHQGQATVTAGTLAIGGILVRTFATTRTVDRRLGSSLLQLGIHCNRDRLVGAWNVTTSLRRVCINLRIRLPVGASYASLEVIGDANARLALERPALYVRLGDTKPRELRGVFVLGNARITHTTGLASDSSAACRYRGNQKNNPLRSLHWTTTCTHFRVECRTPVP